MATDCDNSKKRKRCPVCNKKLGLLPFECKCGKLFCIKHKDPEAHDCTYDFKSESKERLGDKLVKVVNCKINAI
jgi:AN1-type zinc finger protein 5/6